jgi:hypothetical protein
MTKLPFQDYIVIDQQQGTSISAKSMGQQMVTIVFRGSLDRKEYKTYIVESFKNIKQWEEILLQPFEQLRVRFEPTARLSNGNVIDADNVPTVIAAPAVKATTNSSMFEDQIVTPIDEQIKLIGNFIRTIEAYCEDPAVLDLARSRLAELEGSR